MKEKYLYKFFILILFYDFLISFLYLLNINNFYIVILALAYLCISLCLVFFTKIGDFKIFKNKYFEKYYKNHDICVRFLISGMILINFYINSRFEFFLIGIIFILIGLISPYFIEKNWNN